MEIDCGLLTNLILPPISVDSVRLMADPGEGGNTIPFIHGH